MGCHDPFLKDTLAIVQTFRECQNTLPALTEHLAACSHMAEQQHTLASALRRQETVLGRRFASSQLVDGDPPSLSEDTDTVATTPLGMLASFPMGISEQLLHVHQRDVEKLLQTVGNMSRKWQQKTQTAQRKVSCLADGLPNHNTTSAATSSSVLMAAVGLSSSAAVLCGLHHLVALLQAMGAVLQEVTLALRHDMITNALNNSRGSRGATALSALVRRESHQLQLSSMHGAAAPLRTFVEALGDVERFVPQCWVGLKERHLMAEAHILLAS